MRQISLRGFWRGAHEADAQRDAGAYFPGVLILRASCFCGGSIFGGLLSYTPPPTFKAIWYSVFGGPDEGIG